MSSRPCPYVGLAPFTEDDRAFFYGREQDVEVVVSNLYASPLTVFYGASGVGKTSVLLAGVVPMLKGTPKVAVVVFRDWQGQNAPRALKQAVVAEVARVTKGASKLSEALALDDLLAAASLAVRGPVFVVLDQFEEYFLYHPSKEEPFDAELARAINRREVNASFLLSTREDGLSNLDRLQGRIPNLLSNLLRLEHLSRADAARAIEKPLHQLKKEADPGDKSPQTIEPKLIEAILEQVESVRARGGPVSLRGGKTAPEPRVETTYLQMVLLRLWTEEVAEESRELRLVTLLRLGGAERIVSTHLDGVMDRLTPKERQVAVRVLRFLVTPGGSKIAYLPSDLASYAEVSVLDVTALLEKLAAPEARVLRPISDAGEGGKAVRYEIFHDVLAQAVLDWRARAAVEQEKQRFRRWTSGLSTLLLMTLLGAGYTLALWDNAKVEKEKAVVAQAKAEDTTESAEAARQKAELEKKKSEESTKLLGQLASTAPEKRESAVQDLKQMIAADNLSPEVAGVIAALAEPAREPQQIEAAQVVKQAAEVGKVSLPPGVDPANGPRIYVHLASDEQIEPIEPVTKALIEAGYVVPKPQVMVRAGPPNTQVRFFHPDDAEIAKALAESLRSAYRIRVEVKGFPELAERIGKGQLELWLGPNELAAPSPPQRPIASGDPPSARPPTYRAPPVPTGR